MDFVHQIKPIHCLNIYQCYHRRSLRFDQRVIIINPGEYKNYFIAIASSRMRLDYTLSTTPILGDANPHLVDELHTYKLGAWLRITHSLSCINFDFTIPRVITCATNYVTIFAWLKFLQGVPVNLKVYSRRFTPTRRLLYMVTHFHTTLAFYV